MAKRSDFLKSDLTNFENTQEISQCYLQSEEFAQYKYAVVNLAL